MSGHRALAVPRSPSDGPGAAGRDNRMEEGRHGVSHRPNWRDIDHVDAGWSAGRVVRAVNRRIARHVVTPIWRTRFRRSVLRSAPMAVGSAGDVSIHMLVDREHVPDAIASLKSFYRFAPEPYPVTIHDDGSFGAREHQLLGSHLPGVRIVRRALADEVVIAELARRGLERCRALRQSGHVLALKLFDIPLYAGDAKLLLLDSDVLFFERPEELLAALARPASAWEDRYNEDAGDGFYTFDVEEVERRTNVRLVRRFNSGLTCLQRDAASWEHFERWLSLPTLPDRGWFLEQTLTAMESSRRGARALPPEYDVHCRQARRGGRTVSGHYCGTSRRLFYPNFVRRVAPAL